MHMLCIVPLSLSSLYLEPGLVQDLTASFNESSSTFDPDTRMHTLNVVISWDPPTQPNGEITGYTVTVYRNGNTSDIVYNNTMVTDTTVSPQVMVFPFTDYTVSVSASTSAGEGEATEVTIESPEAGMPSIHPLIFPPSLPPSIPLAPPSFLSVAYTSYVDHLSLCFPSYAFLPFYIHFSEPGPVQSLTATFDESSSFDTSTRMLTLDIAISWDPPTQPNGEITGYNVTVYRTDNTSDIVYSNTMVTDTMISPQVEVLPFTDYTVSVSASTSAGEGEATEVTIESPEAGEQLHDLTCSLPPSFPLSFNTYIAFLFLYPLRTWSSARPDCIF